MKLNQIIRERRTIHSYEREELPKEILNEALELATFAPNHKLTFPFLFVHVGYIARKKLADIAVEIKTKNDTELNEIKRNAIHSKFSEQGSIVFFVQKLSDDERTQKEDYATMACAVQNFSLFLWDQGYGSKWSSGDIIRSPKTYGLLGLDPENFEITGMIWAGKFSAKATSQNRPNIKDVLKSLE